MNIPLFDCHCDTIARCVGEGSGLRNNSFHIDLRRLGEYSKSAQVFAVCSETESDPVAKANVMLKRLKREIDRNSDIISLCLSFDDISTAVKQGKIAAIISIEGCEQIESLESAYDLGVRILHPTWNFDNAICGAAMASGSGLSDYGRSFITKVQDMGFALDMSHISEHGFWDTLETVKKPVIAGHSNSKAICDVPRNLSDKQFSALVHIGGGAGINLYPDFLGLSKDIDAVTAHIEHFLSLGGERSVFLGCDLDGIPYLPGGINGVESLGVLYNALLKRNYPEDLVRDIFWGNIYAIMEKML